MIRTLIMITTRPFKRLMSLASLLGLFVEMGGMPTQSMPLRKGHTGMMVVQGH